MARLMRKYTEAKRLRPHKTCALMLDMRGREIRIGEVAGGKVKLRGGQELVISVEDCTKLSDNKTVYCNFKQLPKCVKPKDTIFIDDGKIIC